VKAITSFFLAALVVLVAPGITRADPSPADSGSMSAEIPAKSELPPGGPKSPPTPMAEAGAELSPPAPPAPPAGPNGSTPSAPTAPDERAENARVAVAPESRERTSDATTADDLELSGGQPKLVVKKVGAKKRYFFSGRMLRTQRELWQVIKLHGDDESRRVYRTSTALAYVAIIGAGVGGALVGTGAGSATSDEGWSEEGQLMTAIGAGVAGFSICLGAVADHQRKVAIRIFNEREAEPD
jgi:hypothetical protein